MSEIEYRVWHGDDMCEYRVWCVDGACVSVHDNYADALSDLNEAIRQDHEENGCPVFGDDESFFMQIVEDGVDVSTDPSASRPWNQW